MSKFLVIEEPRREVTYFYNFAIIIAENEKEAKEGYLNECDVDFDESKLTIYDLDDIDENFFYYLEVEMERK